MGGYAASPGMNTSDLAARLSALLDKMAEVNTELRTITAVLVEAHQLPDSAEAYREIGADQAE